MDGHNEMEEQQNVNNCNENSWKWPSVLSNDEYIDS